MRNKPYLNSNSSNILKCFRFLFGFVCLISLITKQKLRTRWNRLHDCAIWFYSIFLIARFIMQSNNSCIKKQVKQHFHINKSLSEQLFFRVSRQLPSSKISSRLGLWFGLELGLRLGLGTFLLGGNCPRTIFQNIVALRPIYMRLIGSLPDRTKIMKYEVLWPGLFLEHLGEPVNLI